MIQTFLTRLIWMVGLTLLQVLILNQISFLGVATPFLYIYFLLKLPTDVSRNMLLCWGFVIGLLVDFFSNTPGMNASVCVLLAFVRPFLLKLFTLRDVNDIYTPSMRAMGKASFWKYAALATLLHHSLLLLVEHFSLFQPTMLLLEIMGCTLITLFCMIALEILNTKNG